MEMAKIRMPNLNVDGLRTGEKFNMLTEYLLSLEKNIRFVLNNLEADNFGEGVADQLKTVKQIAESKYDETLDQTVRRNEFKELVLKHVYPVGAVYMSMNNDDPSDMFGGTWERITLIQGVNLWERTA